MEKNAPDSADYRVLSGKIKRAGNVSRTKHLALKAGLFRRAHVGVSFDLAPLLFNNATQLALHGLESVMDHFLKRFVSAVIRLPFISYKLVTRRHCHVDSAPVWISFVVVVIGLLDGDIATIDVITESLESC